jgi:hypothetical protein
MSRWLPAVALFAFVLVVSGGSTGAFGQAPAPPRTLIPGNATSIEGTPSVRVETTADETSRRVLSEAERARSRLTIKVRDGKLYWSSRDDRPLSLHTEGEYTYLSADPGHYIKLRRLNDRIAYVEHVEQGPGIVTFWGEIRITFGRP